MPCPPRPLAASRPSAVGCSSVTPMWSSSQITRNSVRRTPTTTATSMPASSPLTAVTAATQNSGLLSRQKRTNSAGCSRPSTAMKTRQLSVASGMSLKRPPRKRAQATASRTVTSSLSWVAAPACWLIAVCENPPADGIARTNAPAMHDSPLRGASVLHHLHAQGSFEKRALSLSLRPPRPDGRELGVQLSLVRNKADWRLPIREGHHGETRHDRSRGRATSRS